MAYTFDFPRDRERVYPCLCSALEHLLEGESDITANLANAAALVNLALGDALWVGFYIMKGNELVLGPFQGKPACIRIQPGRGVCGTAAAEDRTLVIGNVGEFPGHIACDAESKSEMVVPIHKDGRVFAVLDIDSTEYDRFSAADRLGLEAAASVIEKHL